MSEINYKIIIDFDFYTNEKNLNLIYSPILGNTSLSIYKNMISNAEFINKIGSSISSSFDNLLNYLQVSDEQFWSSIKYLEAINLIETYKDINKNDLIVFKLREPLKWSDFIKNQNYCNILKHKIGDLEFEKLKYVYSNDNYTIGLTNISSTFDNVFNIKNNMIVNFDVIYDLLFKHTKNVVSLSDNIKLNINNIYIKYQLSYQEIVNLLMQSMTKVDNEFIIDEKIFITKIKQIIDIRNLGSLNLNMKINRNTKIFLDSANINEFKYVINDYKSLNSEQYLSCIQKHPLSDIDIKFISSLRKDYNLPDFVINILIDYCIFINNGRIEPSYISKIAITINRLDLTEISAILKHLQIATREKNKNFNNSNFINKVEW